METPLTCLTTEKLFTVFGLPESMPQKKHNLSDKVQKNICQILQAGVRSFIIIFDVYVILDTFEKYDNKRPDPICRMTPYAAKPSERIQEIIK